MGSDQATYTKKALVAFGIFATGSALLYLLWTLSHLFLLVFAGALLSAFWKGLARWMGKWTGWRYGVTLTIAIVFCFAVLVGMLWYIGPTLSAQMDQLLERLPSSVAELRERMSQYQWSHQLMQMLPDQDEALQNPNRLVGRALSFLGTAFGVVADVALAVALGIFIAAGAGMYHRGIKLLFPEEKRERIAKVMNEVSNTLFRWLVGRIIDMTVLGIATGIGLWFLGFDLALSLGILTALLCFIPNIGPVLSVIPPALLAVAKPELSVLSVLILYAAIQAAESYLLTPLIQKKAVEMPPALLLSAQVAMTVLFGGLGLLLATPFVATAMVVVKRLYIEDTLGTDLEAEQT